MLRVYGFIWSHRNRLQTMMGERDGDSADMQWNDFMDFGFTYIGGANSRHAQGIVGAPAIKPGVRCGE
eukprot:757604-Hanusia_phi.AAC.2